MELRDRSIENKYYENIKKDKNLIKLQYFHKIKNYPNWEEVKKLTIKLENVKKTYDGKNYIVKNLNLEFEDGKFVVLVGPSGCGKSTTLRMIAGLESISEGSIYIDGVRSNDLPSKDRDLAMVFQSYALYPHMTIRENISYPLKIRKLDKNYINQK